MTTRKNGENEWNKQPHTENERERKKKKKKTQYNIIYISIQIWGLQKTEYNMDESDANVHQLYAQW